MPATLAAPLAMLVAAFVFLTIVAIGRVALVSDIAQATRFVHITATLMLPAIAVAADAFIRRWRFTAVIFGVALVASIVGNVREFSKGADEEKVFFDGYRQGLLALPTLPLASSVPRELHPDPALLALGDDGLAVRGRRVGSNS